MHTNNKGQDFDYSVSPQDDLPRIAGTSSFARPAVASDQNTVRNHQKICVVKFVTLSFFC